MIYTPRTLLYTKLREVRSPEYGTEGSAGIDFFVPDTQPHEYVMSHRSALIGTGLVIVVPAGHALIMHNKSGIAMNTQLIVGACVIDSDYRGEVHFHMINTSPDPVMIRPGMKLAQGIIIPYLATDLVLVEKIPDSIMSTQRGAGGFGSTGGGAS